MAEMMAEFGGRRIKAFCNEALAQFARFCWHHAAIRGAGPMTAGSPDWRCVVCPVVRAFVMLAHRKWGCRVVVACLQRVSLGRLVLCCQPARRRPVVAFRLGMLPIPPLPQPHLRTFAHSLSRRPAYIIAPVLFPNLPCAARSETLSISPKRHRTVLLLSWSGILGPVSVAIAARPCD